MTCPHCGSEDTARFKSPFQLGEATIRRHKCSNCRALFMSIQKPVTGRIADELLDRIEDSRHRSPTA